MNAFKNSLKTASILLATFTLLFGILYPLLVWGIGKLFFEKEANGSLLFASGKAVGSALIGQNFTSPHYFHPRPSAADYNAEHSAGTNLGPTSKKLADALHMRAQAFRHLNNLAQDTPIPADAITASASGLDPHISLQNALLQMPRIAAARGISEEALKNLILEHTETTSWWLPGTDHVNVLILNLALDSRATLRELPKQTH